jgi:hypothetical protein
MTAKVVGAAGAWSGMAAALVYGADMGARVSSNSWSYTAPGRAEIGRRFGTSRRNFELLELGHIDSADFWTDRWLSSSSRSIRAH